MRLALLILTTLCTAFAQGGQRAATTQTNGPNHLVLAKAGDREALQYYACRSMTHRVQEIESLMRTDLDEIGGGFTVTIYRELLDSDSRFRRDLARLNKGSDAPMRPPSIIVLSKLSRILPEAGIAPDPRLDYEPDPNQDFGLRAKWRAWIDSHQTEIQKLKPTAEGVSFRADACTQIR
jgi:hypothetical protein